MLRWSEGLCEDVNVVAEEDDMGYTVPRGRKYWTLWMVTAHDNVHGSRQKHHATESSPLPG